MPHPSCQVRSRRMHETREAAGEGQERCACPGNFNPACGVPMAQQRRGACSCQDGLETGSVTGRQAPVTVGFLLTMTASRLLGQKAANPTPRGELREIIGFPLPTRRARCPSRVG